MHIPRMPDQTVTLNVTPPTLAIDIQDPTTAGLIVVGCLIVLVACFVLWSLLRRQRSAYTIDTLAELLDCPVEFFDTFSPEYSYAHIPKRSGGKRRLEIPNPELKAIQQRLLHRVLAGLTAHPAACGFEPGKSIVDAARPHVRKHCLIRIDVVDFFPTTGASRVTEFFRRAGWTDEAANVLTRLTTHEGHLPQGAPTSPRLSNLVNVTMDRMLHELARSRNGHYTRYADDMTFSFRFRKGPRARGVMKQVKRILNLFGYEMHEHQKLRVFRRHQQQRVLGLVVNDAVQLPRKTRRWLRAIRHRVANGGTASLTPQQLAGWEAFAKMVEEQAR